VQHTHRERALSQGRKPEFPAITGRRWSAAGVRPQYVPKDSAPAGPNRYRCRSAAGGDLNDGLA
jgi:hypothetical protein